MAKQTFTTGQVLTAAQVNSLQSNDFNQTVSVKTAAYVLAAADKGTRIEFNTSGAVTCTVNTGLFDAGDTVIIQNRGAGDVTVTAGTATVDTAGSLVLSQYQSGTLYFISASASIFFAAAVGDLTAVTSGTGISISNAGGPVPTITNSMATTIDAKGDLIVGTGSDAFTRLPVSSTNGWSIVADSAETTGLKWQAASSGALTKISSTTFSNVASQDFDSVFSSSYNNYLVVINELYAATAADDLYLRFKYSSTVQATGYYAGNWYVNSVGGSGSLASNGANQINISDNTGASGSKGGGYFYFRTVGGSSAAGMINGQYYSANSSASFAFGGDTQFSQTWTGFRLLSSSTNISGTVTVYGLEK